MISEEDKQKKSSRGMQPSFTSHRTKEFTAFCEKVYGPEAKPLFEYPEGDKIMHAYGFINSRPYVAEDFRTCMNAHLSDKDAAGNLLTLYVNVDDPEAVEARALERGAVSLTKVEKRFWGARWGAFKDPAGVIWGVSSGSENGKYDVPVEDKTNLVVEVAVQDPDSEIKFIEEVFGAVTEELFRAEDKVRIMHSLLSVDKGRHGSVYVVSIFDGSPGPILVPTVMAHDDATAAKLAARMEAEGAEVLMKFERQFWGAQYGRFRDPFGFVWAISGQNPPMDAKQLHEQGAATCVASAPHDSAAGKEPAAAPGSPSSAAASQSSASASQPGSAPAPSPSHALATVPSHVILAESFAKVPGPELEAQIESACETATKVAQAAGIATVPGVKVVQYTEVNFSADPALFSMVVGVPVADPSGKVPFVKTHAVGGEEGFALLSTTSLDRRSVSSAWTDLMGGMKAAGSEPEVPYYEIFHSGRVDLYSGIAQQRRASKRAKKN